MRLPFFPLRSVFYPGETVPLHVFEDRYKQLIHDCREEAITFGIPVYIHGTLAYGTEVQLVEVVTTYPGGEMDVVCVARQVFQVSTFEDPFNGKPYAGGEVTFVDAQKNAESRDKAALLTKVGVLYGLMEVDYPHIPLARFSSFTLAHKMGLSFEQEYELLQIPGEKERLSYLDAHLDTVIALLREVDRTKKNIDLNGHFRNFDPLDFKNLKS